MQQDCELQLETMRVYRALSDRREDWGGKLVLLSEPRCVQTGVGPAVSIARGTMLALGADTSEMKAALRAGYLDFLVYSLDEALRALKNEVRQKRPLTVGLISDVDKIRAEMQERGIQPDLHLQSKSTPSGPESGEQYFAAADIAALRAIDIALIAALPADDLVRHRWIQRAPQFLRQARTGGRWIWLSDAEQASLAALGINPAPLP